MSRHSPGATGATPRGRRSGTPPDTGPLRRFDLAHMAVTDSPPPDFVVAHLAARGEVSQLWGAPGVGKSALAEAVCGGVASGQAVAGLKCKRGRVL